MTPEEAAAVVKLAARGLELLSRVATTIRDAVRNRDPKRLDAIEDSLIASHVEADVEAEIDAARERLARPAGGE